MIAERTISFRKLFLWSLIVACILIACYLSLVSLISIWIGVENIHENGFWVPLLAGILFLVAVLWTLFHSVRGLLRHLGQEDLLRP